MFAREADDSERPVTQHDGMHIAHLIATQQGWPEAAVAIAGIALVGGVIVVVVWQALATWRARIAVAREEAYRELAHQLARELRLLNARADGESPQSR